MNKADLAKMSGEQSSSPRLELNRLQFSGKTNKFELIDILGGMHEVAGKNRKVYSKTDLGENVEFIFLRIRRKLFQFRKELKNLSTNEHNTKHDMLTVFGADKVMRGTNDDMKATFPGLRTIQVVYGLLKNKDGTYELVRMNVKGSSLGSEAKAKGVEDFYSYVQGFKKDGADEHFYEYQTELFGVEEENDLGSYYAMTFKRGRKLTDEEIENLVAPEMTKVYNFITQSDEYYKTKNTEEIEKEIQKNPKDEIDTIEYPTDDEDEINLEDIPF